MRRLFITGIEKNPHKTFITAGLAATLQSLGYTTCVYKPIANDMDFFKRIDPRIKTYTSYIIKTKKDPVVAEIEEGIIINPGRISVDFHNIYKECEFTFVEGTNGLMTPLGQDFFEDDLVKSLNLPVLFAVAPAQTPADNVIININHAIASGIPVRGVILNDCPEKTDMPRLIEENTDAKVLGVLPTIVPPLRGDRNLRFRGGVKPDELISTILTSVDIEGVLDMKIAKLEF